MSDCTSDIATNIENVLLFGVAQHATSLMQGEGRGSFGIDARTVLLFCVLLALGDWLGKRHGAPYARRKRRAICTCRKCFYFSDAQESMFSLWQWMVQKNILSFQNC